VHPVFTNGYAIGSKLSPKKTCAVRHVRQMNCLIEAAKMNGRLLARASTQRPTLPTPPDSQTRGGLATRVSPTRPPRRPNRGHHHRAHHHHLRPSAQAQQLSNHSERSTPSCRRASMTASSPGATPCALRESPGHAARDRPAESSLAHRSAACNARAWRVHGGIGLVQLSIMSSSA
jgi:hypothetical protein